MANHPTLAFNVSPTQLTDRRLGLRIIEILAETGLSPQRLEIEITESALVRDTEMGMAIVLDLHGAGIRIALDDFVPVFPACRSWASSVSTRSRSIGASSPTVSMTSSARRSSTQS